MALDVENVVAGLDPDERRKAKTTGDSLSLVARFPNRPPIELVGIAERKATRKVLTNPFPFLWLAALLGVALVSLSGWPAALAQDFDHLEARLAEHPVLQALRHKSAGLRERALTAVALPDPVLSFGILNFPFRDPSFSRYLPTSKTVGVRQMIPSRARRDAWATQANESALRNDSLIDQRLADLRADLVVALIDQQRIKTLQALLLARGLKYDELAQIVETEIDAGHPVLFRLAEIDVERAEVARTLVDLGAEADQIRARLVELVGEASDTPPPPLSPQAWSGEPLAFHAVRVAQADVSVAEADILEAEAAWKLNWEVQLMYQQRDGPGDDWVSATMMFTVPFWAKRSQAPALREAAANREAARSRVMAATRHALGRYRTWEATRTAAESSIVILSRKIVAIRDQIAARLTIYESGAGDYSPILDGEVAVLKLQGQIAGEQARRDQAIARMNALLVEL